MATIGDQEEGNLLVPTRMPKHLQTGLWPTEAALFRSNLVQYDDIRAMLAEDVPFMRDTVMIATVKYISKNDMRAVTCTSSSISNTLAVWDYVSKHDDVITGAIFKEPAKVVPAERANSLRKRSRMPLSRTILPPSRRLDARTIQVLLCPRHPSRLWCGRQHCQMAL